MMKSITRMNPRSQECILSQQHKQSSVHKETNQLDKELNELETLVSYCLRFKSF